MKKILWALCVAILAHTPFMSGTRTVERLAFLNNNPSIKGVLQNDPHMDASCSQVKPQQPEKSSAPLA